MMGIMIGVKELDGFLFDVRRSIADMISDNYYGVTFCYPNIVEPSDKLENLGLINVKLEIERM